MNVQDLSDLHQRYVDLSHRFRAAWVFHQFSQSLKKVFEGTAGDGQTTEFQQLYTELRSISQALTASESEPTRRRLDDIERRLVEQTASLVAEDTRIPPTLLRQFFHRFQRYDDKILLQLVRFLVYAAVGNGWTSDRMDKMDFLLTRIGQQEVEGHEGFVLLERRRLREIFGSVWELAATEAPLDRLVEERQQEMEKIRAELTDITGLDEIGERGLLGHYRGLKHRLGPLLLEPRLLAAVLETNLAFKNLIRRLYRQEERRLVADYQRIFELEGEVPVDVELARDLGEFRREIEHFEKRLQQDDLRLGDLAGIRSRVRFLLPLLQEASGTGAGVDAVTSDVRVPELPPPGAPVASSETGERVFAAAAEYEEILEALEESDSEASPKAVTLKPAIFSLRIEPREVVAYRRLAGRDHGVERVDVELEQFILRGAALRVQVNRRVEEIKQLLDDSARDPHAPAYDRARHSLRLADELRWRYGQSMQQLLMEGRGGDARCVEVLRMRLTRDYAGLWLMAYKPLLEAP